MKRVLLMGAAAAAFGLGLTVAQASPRVAEAGAAALRLAGSQATDMSSAKKKKKKVRAARSGRDGKGTGGGRGGESGSGTR